MGYRKVFLLSCFLLSGYFIKAQIKEIGQPFINNYSRDEYNAGTHNWSITQDSDGLTYFANDMGVLQFDGTNWNLYKLPNNSKVRSVKWINNKLFAGGYDEFGYFSTDEKGIFTYYSLSDKLSDIDRNFDEIWRVFPTEYGIVFQSFLRIFLFKDEEINVLYPKSRFGFSYYSNKNLFIIDRDFGLSILTSNGPFPIYSNPRFFKDNEIAFIISTSPNDYLIGSTNNGIYQFNGTELSPWRVEINKQFIKDQIYTGLKLNNEQIAIGTIQNGVYILDLEGAVIHHLNRLKGLQNNTVLGLYQDKLDNLWLALDNGIDALEVSSPITNLNYSYGIETSYTSAVYNGILYIGTNQGLFAKPVAKIENRFLNDTEFQLVEGVVGQVWTLGEFQGKLICGNNLGTFIVDAYSSNQISDRQGGWNYIVVPGSDNKLIGGTYTGLQLYNFSQNSRSGWEEVSFIKGFDESCKEFLFDENNYLWITHEYKGVYKLQLSEDLLSVDSIRLFNQTKGLPEKPYSITLLKGKFMLTTGNGIYSYDNKLDTFLLNAEYSLLLNDDPGLTKVKEDFQGNIWYFSNSNMGVLRKQEDGTYSKIITPFNRIHHEFLGSSFENVFVYNQNNVFIGSERGMFHYNPSKQKDFDSQFNAFIGKVIIKGRMADSVLFNKGAIASDFRIPYRFNSISFQVFAPYFEAPGQITYSFKLNGFDELWSPWEYRNMKEYTNLREGDYEFIVRAKNIYSTISETSTFKFTISPPLYRTKMSYAFYVVLIILFVVAISAIIRKRVMHARSVENAKYKKELEAKEETYLEGVKLSEQEIERLKNEKLLIEMRHMDMELANSTMYIIQKNKFLNKVKGEIHNLIGELTNESNKYALRQIVNRIDRDIKSKQQWKVFDKYFDEVHENFINRLKEKHPDITPKDIRLCAYLKMNISTKEIAPLMNISVRGVEISRYRLRKKLNIDKGINLTEYILSI